ncbi:MAG: hypothetical protein KDC44_06640, partial [Phaeodactylibacter sp.]|nr:hypothetical protein [Phaeodactylibacter sp.]
PNPAGAAVSDGIFELFIDEATVPITQPVLYLSRPSADGIVVKEMVIRAQIDSSTLLALVIRAADADLHTDCIPEGIYFERGRPRRRGKGEEVPVYNKVDAFYWNARSGVYYSRFKSRGSATIHRCQEPRQLLSGCFNLSLEHLKIKDRIRMRGCFARVPFHSFLEQ